MKSWTIQYDSDSLEEYLLLHDIKSTLQIRYFFQVDV
jgi:hypothetical protein